MRITIKMKRFKLNRLFFDVAANLIFTRRLPKTVNNQPKCNIMINNHLDVNGSHNDVFVVPARGTTKSDF